MCMRGHLAQTVTINCSYTGKALGKGRQPTARVQECSLLKASHKPFASGSNVIKSKAYDLMSVISLSRSVEAIYTIMQLLLFLKGRLEGGID